MTTNGRLGVPHEWSAWPPSVPVEAPRGGAGVVGLAAASAAILFLLAPAPALGQAPQQPKHPVHLACLGEGANAVRLEPLDPAVAARPEAAWAVIGARAEGPVEACWAWSQVCGPVRRTEGSALTPLCSANPLTTEAAPSWEPADRQGAVPVASDLIAYLSLPEGMGVTPEQPATVTLTAGPADMWREIPRSLLPAWATEAAAVRLPGGDGPWRAQACSTHGAAEFCSVWTDIPDGNGAVALTLDEVRAITREVAGAGGSPLPGARIHLVRPAASAVALTEMLGFEAANADGLVSFSLPAEADAAAVVFGDGHEAQGFPSLRGAPGRIELGRGFAVGGRTVSEAGEPVGARLRGRSFIRDGFGLTQLHQGRASDDGVFRLAGFSAGAATLRAVPAEGDGEAEFAQRLDLIGSVDLGDVVLSTVEQAWVRVVDAVHRSPVAEAKVRGPGGVEERTDGDGLARLPLRFGRDLQIVARGYGFGLLSLPEGVGASAESPFEVALPPALTVTGVYLAPDGVTRARNGSLTAREGAMSMSAAMEVDGAFRLDLPNGGEWEIDLHAGNAGTTRVEVSGVGGDAIDLGAVVAAPAAVISGFVVGDGRQPLAEATVRWTPPEAAGPLLAPLLGRTLTATTGPDGRFDLLGPQPGATSLRFAAEGYAQHRLEILVEGAVPLDVGTVHLNRGRRITVASDASGGTVELAVGEWTPPEKFTANLADGRAVFRQVPEGPFEVVVSNHERTPVCMREVTEETGNLSLRCDDRSVRVTGRVTIDGEPAAGALTWQRTYSGATGGGLPGGFIRRRTDGLDRVDAVVDGLRDLQATIGNDGVYRLDSVLPGAWDVSWRRSGGGSQAPRTLSIPAGEDEVVRDIAYDGVSVLGRVVDAEGRPAAHATVEAFPDQAPVVTDRQGNFRFLGLLPGRYELRARLSLARSEAVEVALDRPGDRASVELRLESAAGSDRLRIEVRGAAGGFCHVEQGGSGQLVQLSAGRAETPLDEKATQVRAACRADGAWAFGGWVPFRDAAEDGLTLDVSDSTASLALVAASDQARQGIVILVPGGWDLGRLRMWFGGAATFSVGETVPNLPPGSYEIRSPGGTRQAFAEAGRVTEVGF